MHQLTACCFCENMTENSIVGFSSVSDFGFSFLN